jgi:hypothetical protein
MGHCDVNEQSFTPAYNNIFVLTSFTQRLVHQESTLKFQRECSRKYFNRGQCDIDGQFPLSACFVTILTRILHRPKMKMNKPKMNCCAMINYLS